MRTADRNRNGELSYTELTSMLGGSPFEDFGKWLHEQGQAGFRRFDADRQGSIDAKELEPMVCVHAAHAMNPNPNPNLNRNPDPCPMMPHGNVGAGIPRCGGATVGRRC